VKILVSGGYGNFGARICRALAAPGIELVVAGRHGAQAEALAAELGHGAQGVALDVTTDIGAKLRALAVDLVIHAAGPFQDQAYAVAQAAAEAGAHYIDLADGRRFVCDFPAAMDGTFRSAGKTAISGASVVPALSSAVVAHLCQGWQRIDVIEQCLAPAQSVRIGPATVAGILSYCGAPITVWDQGRWQQRQGWSEHRLVQFARLRPRHGALCDVPDLELFPSHFAVTQRVMFRAALELRLAQWGFTALAWARSVGLIGNVEAFARPLVAVSPLLNWLGTQLGGMVISVDGADGSGQPIRRAWHVAADHNHGPEIPPMPAILLARHLARGDSLPVGAHNAIGLLPLSEFDSEFAKWGMVTDTIDEPA